MYAGVLAVPALLSCSDSPTGPQLAPAYLLATVNGVPVPAALDSAFWGDGSNRFNRVVSRSLEIYSADSLRYSEATDIVERLPGGELRSWGGQGSSQAVAYRLEGTRLILAIQTIVWRPDGPGPLPPISPPPLRYDTLEVVGSTLVQWKREGPTGDHPTGRVWRMEYHEARPDARIGR